MTWHLSDPPDDFASLPEWISSIARTHKFPSFQEFMTVIGFEECSYQRTFYDPPADLIDFISIKTGQPRSNVECRTSYFLNELPQLIHDDYIGAKPRASVSVISKRDYVFHEKRKGLTALSTDVLIVDEIRNESDYKFYAQNCDLSQFRGCNILFPTTAILPNSNLQAVSMIKRYLESDVIIGILGSFMLYTPAFLRGLIFRMMETRMANREAKLLDGPQKPRRKKERST
ncbi:hypothetical protein ABIC65_003348 [Sphingomonas trueperi]|uniref:hypothetical protein n=1 Tax=Sphingomonas trueperi TaxID=53317 RepID=UPI0033926B47